MTRVIDVVAVTSALGIRFWDPVRDAQVRDGLTVTARPSGAAGPLARAFRTASDVYAFSGLVGAEPEASPPSLRRFVVEVEDARRRFLPVAFEVDLPLPYRGVYLSAGPESPPGASPAGFHLFSAPSRPPAPHRATIRGELFDLAAGRGAAHALVRVAVAGEERHGLADAAGRFAVFFPYPPFADVLAGSPGGNGETTPLAERGWDVEVTVLYDPAAQTSLAGTPIPEHRSVLGQPPASLWPAEPGVPADDTAVPSWAGTLTFREELTVRTEGRTHLLVRPGSTPGT